MKNFYLRLEKILKRLKIDFEKDICFPDRVRHEEEALNIFITPSLYILVYLSILILLLRLNILKVLVFLQDCHKAITIP